MKNKKTTWFLVPVVLAIWGMIGWKVYTAMQGKEEHNFTSSIAQTSVSKIELPDTIALIADYRDPFLDDSKLEIRNSRFVPRDQHAEPKMNVVPKIQTPQISIPVWPVVAYHGLIRRNGDQKTVGFLSVDGTSYFVQGGEGAGAVKVGKMWKDSVEVVWGKERRVVVR